MVTLKLAIKANVYFFFKETKLNIMIFSTVFKEGLLEESKKNVSTKNNGTKLECLKLKGQFYLLEKILSNTFQKVNTIVQNRCGCWGRKKNNLSVKFY